MQSVGENQSTIASEIPLDVLEVIFKSLNPHDLAICCRVNKPVYTLAHEALYRDLRPTRRNVMHLCLKLCNEPQLAHRARTFTLFDNAVDMYLGIISDALVKLSRLHTLTLFIGPLSSWILPRTNPPAFMLRTFSCGFCLDDCLVSFLQNQDALRHIAISAPKNPSLVNFVRPHSFPNLVSLVAPMSVVQTFVTGRPVRHVIAYDTNSGRPPKISCLSTSTSPRGIQRLMLNYKYLLGVGCEELALSTPNLVDFTIDADGVSPDDPEMIDYLLDWIEEYLSYTWKLDCLTIRFHPNLSSIPCRQIDFSDMITSIFAASSRLRHVIITFYGVKARYVCRMVPGKDWYIVND
ncbi:hypothetical protein D9613_005984 [Agrocybe pediades]|uniref:F-box domain-containing protein n=1 Tax=Agrocybe pediades TaxID=84607 RepID=A0A8H4QUX4_9AGAR|nr:hypothetical protein D9613_005984 [Agrocybe pediades]KAF9561306.1 hypothetical protein CPC08DRAFT_817732 [Agrocybe pediades]